MSKTGRAGRADGARKGRSPEAIGTAIHKLTHQLGITRTMKKFDVITSWESIVGEPVSSVAKAQRMENGILYVAVATAPWRTELSMHRLEIVGKINRAMGQNIVKDIRFR